METAGWLTRQSAAGAAEPMTSIATTPRWIKCAVVTTRHIRTGAWLGRRVSMSCTKDRVRSSARSAKYPAGGGSTARSGTACVPRPESRAPVRTCLTYRPAFMGRISPFAGATAKPTSVGAKPSAQVLTSYTRELARQPSSTPGRRPHEPLTSSAALTLGARHRRILTCMTRMDRTGSSGSSMPTERSRAFIAQETCSTSNTEAALTAPILFSTGKRELLGSSGFLKAA
mmetsp:Transcript_18743/g.43904  ORF Transcript_18743/g.43904 Transcript_18743/m.43904 type:complete len:229 (-) Transcript_18743:230-916(-)